MSKRMLIESNALVKEIEKEVRMRKKKKEADKQAARIRHTNDLAQKEAKLNIRVEELSWKKKRLEESTLELKVDRAREEGHRDGRREAEAKINKQTVKTPSLLHPYLVFPTDPPTSSLNLREPSVMTVYRPVTLDLMNNFACTSPLPATPNYPFPTFQNPYPTPPIYSPPIIVPTPTLSSPSMTYTPTLKNPSFFPTTPLNFPTPQPQRNGYQTGTNYCPHTATVGNARRDPEEYIPLLPKTTVNADKNPVQSLGERPEPYWSELGRSIAANCKLGKHLFQNPVDGLIFRVNKYWGGTIRIKLGDQWVRIAGE